MKILTSKYHHSSQSLIADKHQGFKVVVDTQKPKRYPYRQTLSQSLTSVDLEECDIVIHQSQLATLTKCTDFTFLDFSKSTNQFYEAEQCYFYAESEIFITITQDLSNDYDVELFEKDFYKIDRIFYDSSLPNIKQGIEHFFQQYLQKQMLGEKISILIKEGDYFELKTHKIKPLPLDLDTMYNDDFIAVHQHIKSSLQQSNKGVALLHGLAGTGKTNYIKWLITQVPDKKFIFVPTTIIHQLTHPSFLNILLQNKNSVLVLEDCENYIAERRYDNQNTDVVASILNLADGLLSDVVECQIICTFNAQIDKIDTALLRKGRLIAEYRFKALAADKVNAYYQSIGNELRGDKPMTLVEMMHADQAAYRQEEEKKPTFGFVN